MFGRLIFFNYLQVLWEETGCSFLATVIGEYELDERSAGIKRFDIYYDEEGMLIATITMIYTFPQFFFCLHDHCVGVLL
jgi:hypothetical protein